MTGDDFLDNYMLYTSKLESPDSYHLWCGMSTIAACLGRKVWIDMGHFQIYPNMYVVLVSGPGRCRKSVAINAALQLLEDLPDVRLTSDAITREALILYIASNEKTINLEDKGMLIYPHASVTIVSKELSVFIGTGNYDFLSLLTDLFDCPSRWEYRTKKSGVDTIQGVWVNMLAASTPAWLVGSIPISAIGGGFTSRVIFVVEEDVRFKNPWPIFTKYEIEMRESLKLKLEKISMMKGQFKIEQDAFEFYSNWYNSGDVSKIGDDKFAGYVERKHIHLLKASMIVSASESCEGVIRQRHVERALLMINNLERNMTKAFGGVGRSVIAQDIDEVIRVIASHKIIGRNELISITKMNVHPKDLDYVIGVLKSTGSIQEIIKAGKIYYEFSEK